MSTSDLDSVASILRLSSKIGATSDLTAMLKAAADTLAEMLEADRVAIIELNPDERRVGYFVGGGPGAANIRTEVSFEELWYGLSGWVLREHQSALSPKGKVDPRESTVVQTRRRDTDAGSIIVVPFLFQDKVLGTITAINLPDQRDFDEQDLSTMELVASICAVAVENTRLLMQARDSERQLLDENDLKDRLLGIVAHDLRGPLGSLKSLLALLSEHLDEPELVHELAPLGAEAAARTFTLTENLLTWIRSQIKGIPMPVQRVVVADLLARVQKALGTQAAEKSVGITLECSAVLTLETEPGTIETIVRNLVSNAVKFSPSGAEVIVSAERDGPEVIIEVRDSGAGMTDDRIGELFQGKPVDSRNGTNGELGNGLGLMFSSDLAKTVRGWLEASSRLGVGSTFRLIVSDADPEEL